MSRYTKKTDRRPYEERSFSVRAVHRERADLHKLAEVLIRLTLQETGESRAARAASRAARLSPVSCNVSRMRTSASLCRSARSRWTARTENDRSS